MTTYNTAQYVEPSENKRNGKKTVIAVLAAAITALLLIGGFVLYSYLTPVIDFAVSKPVDPDAESYAQMVTVGFSTKLGLPMPPKTRDNLAEFGKANNAALIELHENYTKPMRIEASVAVKDGRTTVTYLGTATDKNGDTVPYEKILTFDFVLTKKCRKKRSLPPGGPDAGSRILPRLPCGPELSY